MHYLCVYWFFEVERLKHDIFPLLIQNITEASPSPITVTLILTAILSSCGTVVACPQFFGVKGIADTANLMITLMTTLTQFHNTMVCSDVAHS